MTPRRTRSDPLTESRVSSLTERDLPERPFLGTVLAVRGYTCSG